MNDKNMDQAYEEYIKRLDDIVSEDKKARDDVLSAAEAARDGEARGHLLISLMSQMRVREMHLLACHAEVLAATMPHDGRVKLKLQEMYDNVGQAHALSEQILELVKGGG